MRLSGAQAPAGLRFVGLTDAMLDNARRRHDRYDALLALAWAVHSLPDAEDWDGTLYCPTCEMLFWAGCDEDCIRRQARAILAPLLFPEVGS